MSDLALHVGVKSDPIECRYSYEWLLDLMAECNVRFLQVGTFCELYSLPDEFFVTLREHAHARGIHIQSVFTSHRELGGFFRDEPGWVAVARRNYERLIEVGALLGAESVGSNPGSVLRDRMDGKARGICTYLDHMKELMAYAAERGIRRLTLEPMSCLAEPPTLPHEIVAMMDELVAHHRANPSRTSDIGVCLDIAHGYARSDGEVVHDHMELIAAALPYVTELHLKNTDSSYGATFGFTSHDRERGVVDLAEVRSLFMRESARLPVRDLVGYLEIGGPKVGRDYSDGELGAMLRESLRYCVAVLETREGSKSADNGIGTEPGSPSPQTGQRLCVSKHSVALAPSVMCADLLRLGDSVQALADAGVDLLHFDLMDARFAPNMPLGLGELAAVRRATDLPFDIHLMVMDNDFFVEQLARLLRERPSPLGPDCISVHVESARHLDRTLVRIRDLGFRAGAALNPATPLSVLDHVAERLDFVLLMTVNPGFAGQPLVASGIRKIADCRKWLVGRGLEIPIEVDGNVSFTNIPEMVAHGADMLVCGTSSVFASEGTVARNVARTRAAVEDGLARRAM